MLSMLYNTCSRCIEDRSIQASWCVVQECSHMCFWMCKMYLFMAICSKTENKCNLSGINLNVILKCNLTEPWK
jgi:hypothetical protein